MATEKDTKANCERFEIDIGMREHGALDKAGAAALDAHLAACAACRQFDTSMRRVEAALHERTRADAAQVDWPRLQGRVRRLHRDFRLKLWLAPLFLLQVPLTFLFGTGHLPPHQMLLVGPPATVAIYVAYLWLVNGPLRKLAAAGRDTGDLLGGYERELRRQRVRSWIFVAANAALVTVSVVAAALEPGTRAGTYAIGVAVFFAAWAAYDLGLKLPRLRAALAEMRR